MDTSLLRREPLTEDESLVDYSRSLTDFDWETRQSLGYVGLQQEASTLREQLSLEKTLIDLDLQPFTAESVEKYKRACERRSIKRLPAIASGATVVFSLGAVLMVPTLVIATLATATVISYWVAVAFVLSIVSAIGCAAFVSRFGVDRYWRMRPFSEITQPIPEFVLQTALDIRRRHPMADFSICTLEENRVVVDPFLVLHGQGRDYYLEVWNEPQFKQEREA